MNLKPDVFMNMLAWLDRLPMTSIAIPALLLGLAPYPLGPEPHLWEKLLLLTEGQLQRPIDVFDLFLHGLPVCVLIVKLLRLGFVKPPTHR